MSAPRSCLCGYGTWSRTSLDDGVRAEWLGERSATARTEDARELPRPGDRVEMVQDRLPERDVEARVVEGEVFARRDRERRSDSRRRPCRALPRDLDAALRQVERRHVGATARQEHGQLAEPAAVLDDLLAVQVTEELGDANEQRVAPGERGEVLALLRRDDRLGRVTGVRVPLGALDGIALLGRRHRFLLRSRRLPRVDALAFDHQPWAASASPSISGSAQGTPFGVDWHQFRVGDDGSGP